jgi:hypothetical protein
MDRINFSLQLTGALLASALALSACSLPFLAAPTATPTNPPTRTATLTPIPTLTLTPTETVTPIPTRTATLTDTAIATWAVPPGSNAPRDYIGREMPPYPSGYPLDAAWIVSVNENYSLQFSLTQDRSRGLIFLDRFLGRDSKGKAHWRIVDAVILPNIPAGQTLISDCTVDGVYRDDLVALGKYDPNEITRVILTRLWQADTVNERLRERDPSSIECILVINN